MIGEINRLTKKDYHDFYNRHVFWTDVPNYDQIFGYAGYQVVKKTEQSPDLGFNVRFRNGGLYVASIEPGSGAASSELREGDVVVKIDGVDPRQVQFQTLAGKTANLLVNRNGSESTIPVKIGSRSSMAYSLAPMPNATAKQLKIREGWLKR
jgi:predicted metalloprotease with PDZ domain